MIKKLTFVSRNKSSVFVLILALIVAGVGAQATGLINTKSGGYLVCVNSTTKVVTHPGKSTCPKGYKKLVLGAQGLVGANGLTGAAGLSGKDGTDGKDGKTLWNGVKDPESTWGVPGDMFINSVTKTLFGPKNLDGTWPAGVSMVGPAGATGAQGPGGSGPAGSNGSNGTNGINATLTCAQGGTCIVGDTGPGGGKVFYVQLAIALAPFQYLEAAPANWAGASDPDMPWCTSFLGLVETNFLPIFGTAIDPEEGSAATSTEIGSGFRNTRLMLENCTFGPANVIALYNGGGKNDWFLPSKDELNQFYLQKTRVGGFVDNFYWSSSESNATDAWSQNIDDGNQLDPIKSYTTVYVRPIRAF